MTCIPRVREQKKAGKGVRKAGTRIQGKLAKSRWLRPGTESFRLFMPEVHKALAQGEISEREAEEQITRYLNAVIDRALGSFRRSHSAIRNDLIQDLQTRLARMDAAAKYDPTKGAPAALLAGIARTLVREVLFRRVPPPAAGGDALKMCMVNGDQLALKARGETLGELRALLEKLSSGERQALIDEFGPLLDYSADLPVRRRRGADPDSLPQVADVLQKLRDMAKATGWQNARQ